jgi:hypothetical protein
MKEGKLDISKEKLTKNLGLNSLPEENLRSFGFSKNSFKTVRLEILNWMYSA